MPPHATFACQCRPGCLHTHAAHLPLLPRDGPPMLSSRATPALRLGSAGLTGRSMLLYVLSTLCFIDSPETSNWPCLRARMPLGVSSLIQASASAIVRHAAAGWNTSDNKLQLRDEETCNRPTHAPGLRTRNVRHVSGSGTMENNSLTNQRPSAPAPRAEC
ncbi:hypothetical protein BU23DRAFT_155970 [Bimuria novae-zelandiae CBS 107.79]|uniref:Uncharacterized protein n=1 Tax=Bimuria novae-zelandiae CBS 107.79 TaxID=1447943 RepID=A0A6A5V9H4_9PLEO|nr:hypothetical protein BU23DRAFT_155970 [Bimuria novae-zelandiae CBS 107.79]